MSQTMRPNQKPMSILIRAASTEVDEVIYRFSLPAKKLVAMVASSTCENVLNKWVGALGFMCPFQPSGLWFHAHFRLNIAGLLPSSWILLSSDELLEEPKNPSKNISLHLSFESLSCFLNLEWHATAILQLNFVYTNEKSINVTLKPLDGMNMPPLRSCVQNFVPKIAWSTPVLGYKPNGGDRGS